MSSEHLDHGPAALLRYLYAGRRSGLDVKRLLDMGMLTPQELFELVGELEQKGMVAVMRQPAVTDVHITDKGVAWVRYRYGND